MLMVQPFAQGVGLGVPHYAVVAVNGGFHAFEEYPVRPYRGCKAVFRKILPYAAHGFLTEGKTPGPEKMFEEVQTGFQGSDVSCRDMKILRIYPVSQIGDALTGLGKVFFARMQEQSEIRVEIGGDGITQPEQNFQFRAEQEQVIHVANIPPDAQRVLDEMIHRH